MNAVVLHRAEEITCKISNSRRPSSISDKGCEGAGWCSETIAGGPDDEVGLWWTIPPLRSLLPMSQREVVGREAMMLVIDCAVGALIGVTIACQGCISAMVSSDPGRGQG